MTESRLSAERSAALRRVALGALLADHFGHPDLDVDSVGTGSAATNGHTAWVMLHGAKERALGHALGWAARAGAVELHLLVTPEDAAVNTRRAQGMAVPLHVWAQQGRELTAVEPLPAPNPPEPVGDLAAFGQVLADAGATVVVEDGVVFGEVMGLEVARVTTGERGSPELRVGVGVYDQAAFAVPDESHDAVMGLQRLAAEVRHRRQPGAVIHPMNRLARERWLRAAVMAHPEWVGVSRLVPVAPVIGRRGLHERQPAAAVGLSDTGASVLVVCTVGVDLDVAPTAAELAVHHGVDEVVVAVPERDQHQLVDQLVAGLAVPARIVALGEPWRSSA